jgi:hypothetical protein
LTAVQSMDKRDVCMLNNIHDMPQEENLCNEQGNAIMLEILKGYNHHMGYVEKDDRITNTYSHWPWKWTKSCFSICLIWPFRTVTSFFRSCDGKKISHRDFWLALLKNRLEVAGQEWRLDRLVGRPPTASTHTGKLDTSFNKHWSGPLNPGHCCVCSVRGAM